MRRQSQDLTLIQTDWRGSMNPLPLSTRGLPLEPGYDIHIRMLGFVIQVRIYTF